MKYVVSLTLRDGKEKKATVLTWDGVLEFLSSYDWSRAVITKRSDL